ncbi:hypothetical protein PS838_01474 [Pseudomonas fluorescens]|nr:hypothetical protein PS838_01474 [Pseudomonas fluorescens]
MQKSILFFPTSLPDETLQSRITRYHLLSGNRSEHETFCDIFGVSPFIMNIIPNRIGDLAARLPGDKDSNLNELLSLNTILPAYRPFLGTSESSDHTRDSCIINAVARIPRREVSIHSMAKICLACVQADLIEEGHSYWHRAHQIPGMTVCWRHNQALFQSCPKCTHPFYRLRKLLPSLANECICGWSPLQSYLDEPGDKAEHNFSLFAKNLLERSLPAVKSEILSGCYTRQAKKMGFSYGQLMSRKKLFHSIQSGFGDEILAKIDNAYAVGKHNQWIRTTTINGSLDMPITRHLILAYHLFETVDRFEKCLADESLLFHTREKKPQQRLNSSPNKRHLYRQKVILIVEARPNTTLAYLWANAYQATLWLTANDKIWISDILANGPTAKKTEDPLPDRRDKAYANIISEGVEKLYAINQKPVRVNITNMVALLPTRLPPSPAHRDILFPTSSHQLKLHHESSWHFLLRKALWVLSEMSRLKIAPNQSNVQLLASVPNQAWNAMVNHFEWDLEKLTKSPIDPDSMLMKTKVSRQWEGPPGQRGPMGGRAYKAAKPTNKDILDT